MAAPKLMSKKELAIFFSLFLLWLFFDSLAVPGLGFMTFAVQSVAGQAIRRGRGFA